MSRKAVIKLGIETKRKAMIKYNLSLCVFVVPALAIFVTFVLFPIIPELKISFQNHNGFTSKEWVGLSNYIKLLTSETFWVSEKNTYLVVLMSLFLGVPISIIFALLMNSVSPTIRSIFKFASVFPSVLSVTVIGKMWCAIFEPKWGMVNSLLRAIGLGSWTTDWLANSKYAMICIILAYLWQYLGMNALLLYTGIKGIPKTYYEAAELDGASFIQASWHVTIPLMQDIIKYVVTTSTLGSLGMFAFVNVMTAGGPGFITRTISYEMYYRAFSSSRFGEGCAVALLFIIQSIIISQIIQHSMAREKIEY